MTVAAIALLPLFRIPALTPPKLPPVLRYVHSIPLVEPPSAKPVVLSSSALTAPRKFYAPQRIPQHVANIVDPLSSEAAPTLVISGPASFGRGIIGILNPTVDAPPPPAVVPQRKVHTEQPIRVTSKIQEAKLVRKVIPIYPRLAIQTRQFGTVRLIATVGKDGHVKEVHVLSGPSFLAMAAVEAVKQWVYQPTLLNGLPVEVIAPIDVNFVLNQ